MSDNMMFLSALILILIIYLISTFVKDNDIIYIIDNNICLEKINDKTLSIKNKSCDIDNISLYNNKVNFIGIKNDK